MNYAKYAMYCNTKMFTIKLNSYVYKNIIYHDGCWKRNCSEALHFTDGNHKCLDRKENITKHKTNEKIIKCQPIKNDSAHDVFVNSKSMEIIRKNFSMKFNESIYGQKSKNFKNGPNLNDFISAMHQNKGITRFEDIPYIKSLDGNGQNVYIEIYGCQMNVNDAEVVSAILKKHNYKISSTMLDANIILLVTCSIRDNAEQKIWNKLRSLWALRKRNYVKIGILGCMAERLKYKIIEKEKIVDVIAGPDSYKDLPRLLAMSNEYETAVNVTLSFDETYADVTPVRLNPESKTAYVSIMRGCDNMCTYCIVPFTRGRERSRPISSILDEIHTLSNQGIKEVTLLGQNVNSYRDLSVTHFYNCHTKTSHSRDFKSVYKNKQGGLRFSDLLDKVSSINSEMRIRFTSPHPKDFPDEVLHLIAGRSNICKHIHLPAQSGNTKVLTRMRRGYTREAYLNLVYHIRNLIPNIALSSDFIAGFCDESEEEFNETLTLLKEVKYSSAYLFAYSMREKTTAYRRYSDNVSMETKLERLQRMIKLYRVEVENLYKNQIGQQQLVLVEGSSKRSINDLQGRNDQNIKVIFPDELIPVDNKFSEYKPIISGDYIVVHICNGNSQILKGIPLYHSSIGNFFH